MSAGNDLEQSVALVAAANKVVQDPNSVGSALRTISLRLRGTSVKVLEEMGEETDGVIESTSKLQAKIKALSGVNILTSTGDYKDTYTILKEIGQVWEDMSDIDQAAILELMAGKNRANTLSAILSNMTDLEGAYETAMAAEGSAMRENERYLESIQGHIDILNNDIQSMWTNFISSDAVKWVVHFLDGLVKIIDKVGVLNSLLLVLGTRFTFKNFDKFFNIPSLKTSPDDTLKELQNNVDKAYQKWQGSGSNEDYDAWKKAKENCEAYRAEIETTTDAKIASDNKSAASSETTTEIQKQNAAEEAAANKMADQESAISDTEKNAQERVNDETTTELHKQNATEKVTADKVADKESIASNNSKHANERSNDELTTELHKQNAAEKANADNVAAKKSTGSWKAFGTSLKQVAVSFMAMYAITSLLELAGDLIGGIIDDIKDSSNSFEALNDKYQESVEKLSQCESELRSLESELDSTNDKIEELQSKDSLSFVEQEELERLKSVSAELEKQISMQETLRGSLAASANSSAITASDAHLNTSFYSKETKDERIEEAKEDGEKSGKAWGLGFGAAVGVAIALGAAGFFTGGATWAALPAALASGAGTIGVSAGIGAAAGGVIGGAVGGAVEGSKYDSETTVKEQIEDMNASRDALIQARDEAYAAYAKDPTNAEKAKAYQDAADNLARFDSAMADHINQQSQYYNTIMTNWNNATASQRAEMTSEMETAREIGDMLDGYNIMMGGQDARFNAINRIFGEEADEDLQKVKAELEAMAEAGEAINLEQAFKNANLNPEDYEEFSDRLHDIGLYAYDCEEAFVKMARAEEDASGVVTIDIVQNLNEVNEGVKSLGSALDEFYKTGTLSTDTSVSLGNIFNSDAVKDEFNEYIEVMMSGNASIEDAKRVTSELASAYVADIINSSNEWTDSQKKLVINTLKDIGINNAEEFLDQELLNSAKKELVDAYADGDVDDAKITAIAEKYGVEKSELQEIINLLIQKKDLQDQLQQREADNDAKNEAEKDLYKDRLAEANSIREAYDDALEAEKEAKAVYDQIQNARDGMSIAELLWQEASFGPYSNANWTAAAQAYKVAQDETATERQAYIDAAKDLEEKGYGTFDETTLKFTVRGAEITNINDVVENYNNQIDEVKDEIDSQIETDVELTITGETKATINNISQLKSEFESFKSTIKDVNEIFYNGQAISEDLFNSLSEELEGVQYQGKRLADAIQQSGSSYIVKDIDLLQKLIKTHENTQKATIKVAKAQALLKYKEYTKDLAGYINNMKSQVTATGKINNATLNNISTMLEQIEVLDQIIEQYALLEIAMSNAGKAYDAFEDAKTRDAQVSYGDSFLEMLKTIDQGILNNETGTEAFQYAVKAILSPEAYADLEALDSVDDRIRFIHDYIDGDPILSQLFSVDEESGELDITTDNVRNFVDMGLQKGVFVGEDATNFELSDDINSIEDLADALGVSEAVALAMLSELEKVDAKWGDILTMASLDSFERDVVSANNAVTDATQQIKDYWDAVLSGEKTFDPEYYAQLVSNLDDANKDLEAQESAAEDNAEAYFTYAAALSAYTGGVKLTTAEVEELARQLGFVDENGKITIRLNDDGTLNLTDEQLEEIINNMQSLDEPALVRVQLYYEELGDEVDEIQAYLDAKDWSKSIVIDGVEIKGEDAARSALATRTAQRETIEAMFDVDEGDTSVLESYQELAENGLQFKVIVDVTDAKNALEDFKLYLKTLTSSTPSIWLPAIIQSATNPNVWWTSNAQGTSGAPRTETSLVGELGPEILVRNGRWTTVGDNGAEFTQVKKGDIIFNHKQTKDLLSKGHIAGRGKVNGSLAFASGTAYYDSGVPSYHPNTEAKSSFSDGAAIQDAWDDATGSVSDFAETMDWIEVLMEEYGERIDRLNAQLENQTTVSTKNSKIDEIIAENKNKYADSMAAGNYYASHAETYLEGLGPELIAAAKNGAITITEFEQKEDEATVEAIKNYREYAKKADEMFTQAEETITEIRDLAIQKIDNIKDFGDAETNIEDLQTERLQNQVDLDEAMGLITSPAYYEAMMENSGKKIKYWTPLLQDMQAEFNEAVESGQIAVGSVEWYENLAKIYEVQAEIDTANAELEEFQNAINDIYWDNFDQLINRLDYIQEETQSLIDLMDSEDMVITPETSDGWSADQVEWTKEGLATLGLYAQQMETAEYTARQYAEAIDDLTADYENGLYSENEYLEKLNELKQGQYDSIEAYQDAQDAIKDMQKARVDEIKNGIDKQIDAYSKLIEKQKEALSSEKDLYDFQKSVNEKSKNIADIERKLAALANDTSMSAMAKRRQLEAELAEARAEQEELYYNRSVDKQQEALDKELEDYKEQKDAEKEEWDKWLENIEDVVTESLGIVQANAAEIGQTLTDKANEYNLTVSDAILSPWEDGALAVSSYQTSFDTAMSSTTTQLDALKTKWQEVIDKMTEAGNANVNAFNTEHANYASATNPGQPESQDKKDVENQGNNQPDLSVGSYVEVKPGTKWYADSYGGGGSGNAKSGTIKYINTNGSHSYNIDGAGWIKKTDIEGYAKGTTGVSEDQLAMIDELGEELVFHAANGKLAFLTKGSSVVPHDITENIMKLGSLDPSDVLSRSTPQIGIHPSIHNTEISISMDIAEVVHIDQVTQDTIPDLTKAVRKEMDSYMLKVNNAIRSKVR